MELLDLGSFHTAKIKHCKRNIALLAPLFFVAPAVTMIIIGEFSLILTSISLLGGLFVLGIFGFPLKDHTAKLNRIKNEAADFEEFTLTTQVVSKSHEATTSVSGQQGYVSSSTSHRYIVGVRTNQGRHLELDSKQLFMSIREGEYVDVLIKQIVDKNDKLLDSSYIPLMNTIKASL